MPEPRAPVPQSLAPGAALTAPHVLEYPYTRSTGDVIGRFFANLKQRQITAIRTPAGRVLCPPLEYDPQTGASLLDAEWIDLPDTGTVISWTWIEHPRPNHPVQQPFAFALIQIDGADTAMLHTIVVPTTTHLSMPTFAELRAGAPNTAESTTVARPPITTGMRVRAHWREEPTGDITDIEYFEPEGAR